MLWLHIVGGGIALVAGFVALHASKGATWHRVAGRVFVYAMLTMGLSGAAIAAVTGVETSVVMGVLAAYLVVTGWTTVAPPASGRRAIGLCGASVAFTLAGALANLGLMALSTADGAIEGLPAPMAFLFAIVAFLAGVSDVRRLTWREPQGAARLVRHLWRMCFALFVASASFFLGQMNSIPEAVRHPAFLMLPVLAPLAVMASWVWRVRRRRGVAVSA